MADKHDVFSEHLFVCVCERERDSVCVYVWERERKGASEEKVTERNIIRGGYD